MRLSQHQRKIIADKFLAWLKDNNIKSCNKTYDIIRRCSEEINEEPYNLWKAYDLLRVIGKIELNNPNGKHGFTVWDFNPLNTLVIKSPEYQQSIKRDMLVNILKMLRRKYSYIWDECIEIVSKE